MCHVFVLNLDRSPDRLAFMERQARDLGFTFQRIRGCDGTNLPLWLHDQFLEKEGSISTGLSAREVGCYASHLTALRALLKSGQAFAIILEDDAVLAADFIQTASTAVAACGPAWDVIHLSTVFKRRPFAVKQLPNSKGLVRYLRLPSSSVAYAVSRRGALKLLRPGKRTWPVDMEFRYAWQRHPDVWGVYPAVAFATAPFASTISDRDHRSRKALWRPRMVSQIYGQLFIASTLAAAASRALVKRRS